MNYRHGFHAGNFADVLKHVVLLRLLRGLQVKEKGILYLDTHAGRGSYDLIAAATGRTQVRAPEWPEGIGRIIAVERRRPSAIEDYLAVVQEFDAQAKRRAAPETETGEETEAQVAGPGQGEAADETTGAASGLRFYPGSPWLAAQGLRAQDRALLCERQPDEAATLAEEFVGRRRIAVRTADGYEAVRANLPPPERRALVLIDPPFESGDEWALMARALREGLARLPGGTFAVWYPLTARARLDAFYREVLRIEQLPPCCTVELLIGGAEAGLKVWGCGVLVINPPWGSVPDLDDAARWLAPVLGQAEGARGGVHWLVSET